MSWLQDLPVEDLERMANDYTEQISELSLLRYDLSRPLGKSLAEINKRNLNTLKRDLKNIEKILANRTMNSIMDNPRKRLNDKVINLMREIKESQYGKPIDQLDRVQYSIAFHSDGGWFENDNGYIKLTPRGKQRLSYEMSRKYKNPHGFVIIDEHLNVIARGKDYDKLQDKVDRHNEDSDNVWMVVDASDLAELNIKRNSKAKHTYKPEKQYNHYVLRNDKGNYIRREIDGAIARFKTKREALDYVERETLISEVAEMFENLANENINELYRGYRNAVYEMARQKGIAIKNVDIYLREKYAIASDNNGYLYKIKLTPKGVSRNWVAASAHNKQNPISESLKDAIGRESDQLAAESDKLKQVANNPHSSTLEDEGYTFVAKLGKTLYVDNGGEIEEYFLNDNFSGWTLRFRDHNYEFARTVGTMEDLVKTIQKNPRNGENEHYGKVDFFDDKVDEISAEFTGRISGELIEAHAADGTPHKLARLGHLRLVKIIEPNGGEIELRFTEKDKAWLAADRRKNLYFVGKDATVKGAMKLPPKGQVVLLGNVVQVDYFTAKEHIESAKPTYFYHELGEVDGITPTAYIDSDGFIRLYGGNYDIWTCGIVN